MNSKLLFIILAFCAYTNLVAQKKGISAANAHSHNDYLQPKPFHRAYQHRFGSLEADIFFRNDSLFVAHEKAEISSGRTFEALYLNPILEVCKANSGAVYPDTTRHLQLLIDLKTPYSPTLKTLVRQLDPYRDFWYPRGKVHIVISGNTPPPAEFSDYPGYIFFDGRPETRYTGDELARIGLISQSYVRYASWKGHGTPPPDDIRRLKDAVAVAHRQNKPFRFWANPDTPEGWDMLIGLKVDYINTDRIEALAEYLQKRNR